MKKLATAFVLAASATSAYSEEICNDLWFARNSIFQAAGYCFGSQLGQSLFDNAECTTSTPTLDARDRQKVSLIKQREAELGCQVETGSTAFELTALSVRKVLTHQPVRADYESACIGWQGPETRVFAGKSDETPVGSIGAGDNVLYSHQEENGWFFVTIYTSQDFSELKGAGWLDGSVEQVCEAYAG